MVAVAVGGGLFVTFRHLACGCLHIIQPDQLAAPTAVAAAAAIHWEQLAEKLYRFPPYVYPQCNWGFRFSSGL